MGDITYQLVQFSLPGGGFAIVFLENSVCSANDPIGFIQELTHPPAVPGKRV